MNTIKKLIVIVIALAVMSISPRAFAQGDRFDGKPSFSEGAELGYYIWRDGETWNTALDDARDDASF